MTPDALVAAVQAKGSDATTPRDAAHEACHALAWGVSKKWTRDNIHAKKPRSRHEGLSDEITARAVEAKVCEKLGIPHDLEKWVGVCFMELLKNERISVPFDWLLSSIKARLASPATEDMATRVLGLAQ